MKTINKILLYILVILFSIPFSVLLIALIDIALTIIIALSPLLIIPACIVLITSILAYLIIYV